jgi:HK97 family phage major capsid protein
MDENKQIQLDMEQLRTLITNSIADATKAQGMDSVDRKHGIFPDAKGDTVEGETKSIRFKKWLNALMRNDVQFLTKDLTEGATTGSYTVPVEYTSEIMAAVGNFGKARRYCRVISPSTFSIKIPELSTDVTIYVPGESTAYTETNPVFAQKTLTIKSMGGISILSNELLADNNVDILSFIKERFALQLAKFEDTHTFGNSSTYFTPLLNLSSGTTVTMASSSITAITADDFQALRRAVSEDYWGNAKFFMHPFVLSYVEQIKDSSGAYLVKQPANGTDVRTIWGHEVVTVSGMPSSDAAATSYVGFADPMFCVIGTRGALEAKILTESTVGSTYLGSENLTGLRMIERFGQVWTNEAGTANLKTAA